VAVQVVGLRRCIQVTDVGVASIASAGQLRVLNVNKLHKLGVLAVKAIIATCRWVVVLGLVLKFFRACLPGHGSWKGPCFPEAVWGIAGRSRSDIIPATSG